LTWFLFLHRRRRLGRRDSLSHPRLHFMLAVFSGERVLRGLQLWKKSHLRQQASKGSHFVQAGSAGKWLQEISFQGERELHCLPL
jgi:hypothetical protein